MPEGSPSSNPFRRKGTAGAPPAQSNVFESHGASANSLPHIQTAAPAKVQKKHVKRVRVQSPPPSPEEELAVPQSPSPTLQDGSSSVGLGPFDEPHSDFSETEDTITIAESPANPFQETLATLERTEVTTRGTLSTATIAGPGRAAGRKSLDVEAFKRLLMTGSAGITDQTENTRSISTNPFRITTPLPTNVGHTTSDLDDGGNSTKTSSISRQSTFETAQEVHLESPRTSDEVFDSDDDRRRVVSATTSVSDRKKPAPPDSRHGKLIKVELREDGTSTRRPHMTVAPGKRSSSPVTWPRSRSPKDLNKPLPPAPALAGHESDRESIFDKEAAGKIPEPLSPSTSLLRKTLPSPPLSRRSQVASNSKPSQSPTEKLPPNIEEDRASLASRDEPVGQSTTNRAPPPPPRRPSTKNSSPLAFSAAPAPSSETDRPQSKFVSVPLPPPTRTVSVKHSNRPPSVVSMDGISKRTSTVPPPPPPPRQRASSQNSTKGPVIAPGSSPTSGDYLRQDADSARDGSVTPQPGETIERVNRSSPVANHILSDLTALQREVDELRGQYEKRSASERGT